MSTPLEMGLRKPATARSNVWKYVWKYDKYPKKTVNDWEHHSICAICMDEDLDNATVKLGSSDSPNSLVEHFLHQHKVVWEHTQNEQQSSITFISRDESDRSTRVSPQLTPTESQRNVVDERRTTTKSLFERWTRIELSWGRNT